MTLIELLVVIAIIGVLASMIFPVASAAKARAKKAQCMNNMMQIFTALKQFQLDEHKYPEFIVGPVQWKDSNGMYTYMAGGTIVTLNQNTGMVGGPNGGNGRAVALYPEYISELGSIKCPTSDLNEDWVSPPVGSSLGMGRPYTTGMRLNASGTLVEDNESISLDPMFPILSAFNKGPVPFRGKGPAGDGSKAFSVYKYSSYDYQRPLKTAATGEIHYSTSWSDYDPTKPMSTQPGIERQLRWRTPPSDTVVTWCAYHRNMSGSGVPTGASKDTVLFLDGHVDQKPSPAFIPWTTGWNTVP